MPLVERYFILCPYIEECLIGGFTVLYSYPIAGYI